MVQFHIVYYKVNNERKDNYIFCLNLFLFIFHVFFRFSHSIIMNSFKFIGIFFYFDEILHSLILFKFVA